MDNMGGGAEGGEEKNQDERNGEVKATGSEKRRREGRGMKRRMGKEMEGRGKGQEAPLTVVMPCRRSTETVKAVHLRTRVRRMSRELCPAPTWRPRSSQPSEEAGDLQLVPCRPACQPLPAL